MTDTSNLLPSLVRTFIPLVVGVLASLGLDANEQGASVILTAVVAFVFYAVVRFLEVFAGPKWGYILGVAKSPGYSNAPAPANAPVGARRITGDAGLSTAATAALVAAVVVLVILFVLPRL